MKVLTFGVYDMLHIGHILLFKHAKGYGDELIVAVQDGDVVKKYKPEANLIYSTDERIFMVNSVRWVDKTVIYKDVDIDIQNIDFDIFVKGPDQMHEGFKCAEKWCYEHGKRVIEIPRTEGISSSMLRSYSKNK